ncbi:amino acid permease [Lapidilactobacillus dextrinicus DSM 20335]|uniref:Amino acid permease n=1 Tax=Lapidilactobacillus dextrinicus DSM 20335 TaxID=1423738 RepID=A0A0R2BHY9_9LACO|nr:amino acid permease [Lapidilactobacillus dextrinicus]KRM78929.1 amino acid permease [Lapidilactobacillus dextrinicus DSM 20335]QFG45967.1 amino acid permease [Lapidilactobacillus dextrinicus]
MAEQKDSKQLFWYNIALLAFVAVWGLGNVVNNFAQEGLVVVVSWILIMVLYFVPYTLMVGQMGATFKDAEGGVSSWIKEVSTKRLAYFAAWTYWVVHIPYLAQKPQAIMIALSWFFSGNGNFVNVTSSMIVQALSLVIFLIFLFLASRGITTLNRIGSIAGMSMFVMSILFIILGLSAPAMTGSSIATANMNHISTYIPKFDFKYFTTISMLVFAVGGAEKISPYVNKTKNPAKNFPKGMIALAIMVAVSAIMGSFAMGMIFDAKHIPSDLMANGAYVAFQRLGKFYHVGNILMYVYAIANAMASIAAFAVSIDAPLRILLDDADPQFVPAALRKKNADGVPVNGYKLTGVLVGIIIIIPALGIGGTNTLYNWLLNLNSVVMPLRYLWVFLAFMLLNKHLDKFHSDYMFVKNSKLGFGIGLWCFVFTAFACILGMVPKIAYATSPTEWWFQLVLNIAMPIFLISLGLILPAIARRQNREL